MVNGCTKPHYTSSVCGGELCQTCVCEQSGGNETPKGSSARRTGPRSADGARPSPLRARRRARSPRRLTVSARALDPRPHCPPAAAPAAPCVLCFGLARPLALGFSETLLLHDACVCRKAPRVRATATPLFSAAPFFFLRGVAGTAFEITENIVHRRKKDAKKKPPSRRLNPPRAGRGGHFSLCAPWRTRTPRHRRTDITRSRTSSRRPPLSVPSTRLWPSSSGQSCTARRSGTKSCNHSL